MAPRFDLQSHSRHSDGALEAGAVVRAAAEEGIELLALSDHDTVDGVDEALAVAGEVGVALVPAA
ncbi:MAG TPA: PHP domain-containing protein, partial [Solirubrobacteraceae bacterium]|nr:PHP domain-containing protein [Solirubrobacteraceae bacterium]